MTSVPQLNSSVFHLRQILEDSGGNQSGWDAAWTQAITPWDAQDEQPQLAFRWAVNYPSIKEHLQQGGKGLVAGCGRGYDAQFLAHLGFTPAIGVDISPKAVEAANEWFASKGDPNLRQSVHFIVADFFKLGSSEGSSLVGRDVALAYDYTFFCAIPTELRASWAETYSRVIKAGGLLCCLVFPIHGDRPGGPPYSVSPDMYRELLSPTFELLWEGSPLEQVEARKGVEQIQGWRRKA